MRRLGLLLLLAACGAPTGPAAGKTGPPTVYVVNYPLQYFAERIGGGEVRVVFPALDGDPAFWKPDGEAIAAFQSADLILLNGAGYAKWIAHASLPESRCVDTSAAFKDRFIRLEDAPTHTHGPTGAHEHGRVAFTTWLDLTQAVAQAYAIRHAFLRRWPEGGFQPRFEALRDDLLALARELGEVIPTEPVVASHPVYQYLARRHDLKLRSVHWEPETVPDAKGWSELQAILEEHPAKLMLWEGTPMPETVRRLAALGLKSAVFDPCGNVPARGDFLDVMQRNVANLKRARAD
ncbi:MAG: metal ABC transporter substrate-binding protein [Planctomycetota bacterium]